MLIAEIYPIQRLPRRFSAFDYLVPEEIKLERGFFVRVPFRNQQIVGVVKELHERFSPRSGLKKVLEILETAPLTENELQVFEWLAKNLAQGVPAVLNAAVPLQPKRLILLPSIPAKTLKIKTSEAPSIQRAVQTMELHRQAFISAADLPRMATMAAAFLHAHPNDRAAIIVPGVREAEALAPYFSGFGVSMITGEKTEGRCFLAWDEFRRGKSRVLLGTRLASLLIPSSTEAVFVFRSGHESHKQWDRNPRYDARETALEFQKRNNSRLYFFDSMPRPDDFITFQKDGIFIEHPEPRPHFVNLNEERPMSPHPIISWTLDGAIQDSLKNNRRVLCVYNRKGKASSMRCADCGYNFPCPGCGSLMTVYETSIKCHRCGHVEPLVISCPKCDGVKLGERGFGNLTIKKILKQHYPEASVAIIDQSVQENENAQILLVTSYYLESYRDFFAQNNFGLVAYLDADFPLLSPGFRAFENALRAIEDLRGLARHERATFIVQTRNPEIFNPYYNDPKGCLEAELELRKAYDVPPFVRWLRLKIRDIETLRAELELKAAAATLKPLVGVRIFPVECNQGRGCEFSVAVDSRDIDIVLEKLSSLPDRIIIDTNAIS